MTVDAAAVHADVLEEMWAAIDSGSRTVLAESPPGAGKSTLIRNIAARIAKTHPAAILTQTNDQADDHVRDLVRELASKGARVGRLHSSEYGNQMPADLRALDASDTIDLDTDITSLGACDVIVATAAKWAHVDGGTWPIGLIDEVYQMRSDLLMSVAPRFNRFVGVGDPGQLHPWSASDDRIVKGVPLSPLETAGATLLASHPDTPILHLPVSWRLRKEAAQVVSKAFYAKPFRSGATNRGLTLPIAPLHDTLDAVIRGAAHSGWSVLEMPSAYLPQTDPELVTVIAQLVVRLITSGATYVDGSGAARALAPSDVAIGVAHRDQRGFVRLAVDSELTRLGLPSGSVVVDTANRLQGRQFQVVLAWHPLSGRRDATEFHLEAGRLCVLMSRHRQCCIVVARGGIRQQLEAYPGTDPVWLGEKIPAVDGWTANLNAIEFLERYRLPYVE